LIFQVSIKILNVGAWARTSERVPVTLPRELEDFIPEVEEFYKTKHSGRKLQWHHHMSNGTVSFSNKYIFSSPTAPSQPFRQDRQVRP
jgi:cullin-5